MCMGVPYEYTRMGLPIRTWANIRISGRTTIAITNFVWTELNGKLHEESVNTKFASFKDLVPGIYKLVKCIYWKIRFFMCDLALEIYSFGSLML